MKKIYTFKKPFFLFLKYTLGLFVKIRFNVKINKKDIKGLKPPFLVVGNHISFWDPFFLSIGMKDPVNFLISDSHFRHYWFRQVLQLIGGVPKKKQQADSKAIRILLNLKKMNKGMGLYPEGSRSWDGSSLPIYKATGKLAKNLNVPVVSVKMEGGGLSKPRWAKFSRRGRVDMTFSILYTKEDLAKLTHEEVLDGIKNSISVNEYDWQRKNMVRFIGRNLARDLELLLYMCPKCHKMTKMKSDGDDYTCNNCGYHVK